MITLDVNPIVLEALKAAFPNASSAERALKKYVRVLSGFINRLFQLTRDPISRKKGDIFRHSLFPSPALPRVTITLV